MTWYPEIEVLPLDDLAAEECPSPPPRSAECPSSVLSPSQIAAALEDVYEAEGAGDERKRRLLRALLWAAAHADGPTTVSTLLAFPDVTRFLSLDASSVALASELRVHDLARGDLRELSGEASGSAVILASTTGRQALEADFAEAADA